MSAAPSPDLRKGWCPGALRPMAAADGLIVRLRLTGGILPAAAAKKIADLAERYGTGKLDLSARANLQMRGVREASLPALIDALRALGLVDDDAAAEAVRNVIASPLAGLRDGLDIRPIVAALEARLVGTQALHGLPTKFGFLIDDGSAPSLADVAADVRFDWRTEAGVFAIGLGGARDEATWAGMCDAAELVDHAETIARGALALFARFPEARRLHALIATLGPDAIRATCYGDRDLPAPLAGEGARRADEESVPKEALRTGEWAGFSGDAPSSAGCAGTFSREGKGEALTLATPYGRLDTAMLHLAADLAAASGGELRLTPWRSLLLPDAAAGARQRAQAAGFIVTTNDPRLQVAACVGAPDCARATTATRADADALVDLAPALGPSISLHVSGCAKGCAHAGPARATLVARDGRYDLVRDGRAGDPPTFQGLDLAAARAALAALGPA